MNYIRWKEARLKDNKFDSLERGRVYRDSVGNVFLYVGYCHVDLKEPEHVMAFKGDGHVLILICESYTSPILEVHIRNLSASLDKGYSSLYTNLSEDIKDGGRTLFVDTDEEHLLTRELTEFLVPDEVLWKIKGIYCDYCDICSVPEFPNCFLNIYRLQSTKSYEAYLVDSDNKPLKGKIGVFYDVSLDGESLEVFKNRMYRKLKLYMRLNTQFSK